MRTRTLGATVWAALFLIWAAGSSLSAWSAPAAPGLTPGSTTPWPQEWAGQRRQHLLYWPTRLAPQQLAPAGPAPQPLPPTEPRPAPAPAGVPLILALHGGGGHAEVMLAQDRYHLRALADRLGAVLVAANGHSRWPGGRLATWNAGGCCAAARDDQADDVGLLRDLVAQLRQRLPIDAARVVAVGMSNGGMMALRLGCEAPDVFGAVAAVAGTEATASCTPSRPVAVLQIHALDDDHVRYSGGAGEGAFRDRRQVMDFVSVPETVARWRARNHCPAQASVLPTAEGAHCERYAPCDQGVAVQHCATSGGGHSWPGGQKVLPWRGSAPSTALDASQTLGDFLLSLPAWQAPAASRATRP